MADKAGAKAPSSLSCACVEAGEQNPHQIAELVMQNMGQFIANIGGCPELLRMVCAHLLAMSVTATSHPETNHDRDGMAELLASSLKYTADGLNMLGLSFSVRLMKIDIQTYDNPSETMN